MRKGASSNKLLFAHYLRAVAIISVVLTHYGSAFFNNNPALSRLVGVPPIADAAYPRLVTFASFFPALPGFLAIFGVAIFFLISGFVIPFSLEKHGFLNFWKHRFFRLFPTYVAVLALNQAIALAGTSLFHFSYDSTPAEIAWQLLMGLQNLIPGMKVLDPVCWTLGVELLFYFLTSLTFQLVFKAINLYTLGLLNLGLGILVMLSPWAQGALHLEAAPSFSYLAKALALVNFMLIGTSFSLYHKMRITKTQFFSLIGGQFIWFCFTYNEAAGVVQFLPTDLLFDWYLIALLVFLLLYTYREDIGTNQPLNFIADVSYPFYLCHSYLGYFLIAVLMMWGLDRNIAFLLPIPFALIVAYLLHRYVERPAMELSRDSRP